MPQPGIKPAQVAIKVKVRPGLFKGTGDVLQAYPCDGQNHGLVILWRRVGLPYRFQTLLGQIAETQVMQGLQVALADGDVDTMSTLVCPLGR